MILRAFNEDGIRAFSTFLQEARDGPYHALPEELLESPRHTVCLSPDVMVETRSFTLRREAALYLHEALSAFAADEVRHNAGLWTWLTLFYFKSICPAIEGKRVVKNDYYYIFEPDNPRHFYRHLLFIGWRVLQSAPEHNRLYLDVPVSSLDKVTTEVMKRLYITRIPCIFEVLDRVYWDPIRSRARVGIVGQSPVRAADLTHRLPLRIRQLEKTYDLQSLSADQLIELLGREFAFKDA